MPAEFNPERSLALPKGKPAVEALGYIQNSNLLVVVCNFCSSKVHALNDDLDALNKWCLMPADARTALPEACRRLVRLRELLGPGTTNAACHTAAEYKEIWELLTWEPNDG